MYIAAMQLSLDHYTVQIAALASALCGSDVDQSRAAGAAWQDVASSRSSGRPLQPRRQEPAPEAADTATVRCPFWYPRQSLPSEAWPPACGVPPGVSDSPAAPCLLKLRGFAAWELARPSELAPWEPKGSTC
jgi:hypothetical protein